MSVPGNVIPEQQLVLSCAANDRKAQEELYKRYYNPMLALCFRYTRNQDDAIEVLHHGLMQVFKQLANFDSTNCTLYNWIHATMVRSSIDFLRRRKLKTVNIDWKSQADPTIAPDLLVDLSGKEIFHFLQQLPEMTAAIFNLHAIEAYKHKQIAELLQITEGTIKWHLSDARRQLTNSFAKRTIF